MTVATGTWDRYPGIKAFEKNQAILFKGRDKEIYELYNLILAENCVVVFARSGLGKSSLLNAGICPLLERKGFISFGIRVQLTGDHKTPLSVVKANLQAYSGKLDVESHPGKPIEELPLWEFIKSCDFPLGFTPVLVLDQFEEFFANKQDHRTDFLVQLSELLHNEPPARILHWYRHIPIEQRTIAQVNWCSQPRVKIVIGIREDRLGELDSACMIIPSMLRSSYKLYPLNLKGATEAIEEPASFPDTVYNTEQFTYHPDSLKTILNKLSGGKKHVETTQLQIVCQQIEKIVKKKQEFNNGEPIVVQDHFFGGKQGIEDMIRNFYIHQIKTFTNEIIQQNAKDLVELQMVQNGKRILLYEDQVTRFLTENRKKLGPVPGNTSDEEGKKKFLADEAAYIIRELVELRLIRTDYRDDDKMYEISHDTLLDPVGKAIEERLRITEKENQERERQRVEQEKAEQKKMLAEEKKRARKERDLKENAVLMQQKAERALKLATLEKQRAEEATIVAIEARREADKARRKARRLSTGIFVFGVIAFIGAIIIFAFVQKQKAKNNFYLSNVFAAKAEDNIEENRFHEAFNYAWMADSLRKGVADSSFKLLETFLLRGKSSEMAKTGNLVYFMEKDSIYLWDITKRPIHMAARFYGIDFEINYTGSRCLAKADKETVLWDVQQKIQLKTFPDTALDDLDTRNVKFSRNGQSLAFKNRAGELRVYQQEGNGMVQYRNRILDAVSAKKRMPNFSLVREMDFSSDGNMMVYFDRPDVQNLVSKKFNLYVFSGSNTENAVRIVQDVTPLIQNENGFLHGDTLLFKAANDSCYFLNIKTNQLTSYPGLTSVVKNNRKADRILVYGSELNIAMVATGVDNYEEITKAINVRTGQPIATLGPEMSDIVFLDKFFYYSDSNNNFSARYYDKPAPFFTHKVHDLYSLVLSDDASKLVYYAGDSVYVWNIANDSLIQKIYQLETGAVGEMGNDFFWFSRRLATRETDYMIVPFYPLTKEQLRKIYPDLTRQIKNEYQQKVQ